MKWNYQNRIWNYFFHFQASDQTAYFTKCFSFDPRSSKLIYKIGSGIIQTGNGIISPTARPLIKKLLLQNVYHLFKGFQNWFSKQDMEISKQEMELFLPLQGPLIKKLILQNNNHLIRWVQNRFWKQEMELSKQEIELSKKEMELFLPLPGLWSQNFY